MNIFGIISGYVGYREPLKKTSYAGYPAIWLTVVFYGTLFTGIYTLILPGSVTGKDLAQAFFPVTCNLYWYFSSYTLVFFFAPLLNKIIYHSSVKELKLILLLICCIVATIEFANNTFNMDHGYSSHWLILLYLVGGIMKKTGIGSKLSVPTTILGILMIDIGYFLLELQWPELPLYVITINFNFLRTYITPFYLAAAILHVILFSKFRFPPFFRKLIAFAAPAAFSVYIANTNPLFWRYFMKDRFISWADSSPAGIFARTILFSGAFVLAVIFLDFLRQKLFRLLGVQNWVQKLSASLQKDKAV